MTTALAAHALVPGSGDYGAGGAGTSSSGYPARGGDSTHESPRTSHPLTTTAPPDAPSVTAAQRASCVRAAASARRSAREPRGPSRVARRGSSGLTPEAAPGPVGARLAAFGREAGVRRCVNDSSGYGRCSPVRNAWRNPHTPAQGPPGISPCRRFPQRSFLWRADRRQPCARPRRRARDWP